LLGLVIQTPSGGSNSAAEADSVIRTAQIGKS
jgi:hypothetical protein